MPSPRFVFVCLTVTLTLAAIQLCTSRAAQPPAAIEFEKMPALQGEEAKAYLQRQSSYASLQEAIKAARYQVHLEATPFADLPEALQADNPAQHFNAYFTSAGMRLAVRDKAAVAAPQSRYAGVKRLEMRLEAIGYGEQLNGVPEGELQQAGNRIELRRGEGLVEWYENRPQGLEQGFRLATPQEGRVGGAALRLKLGLGGELKAEIQAGDDAVTFRDGEHLLRYDGLKVYDAEGQKLQAQMKLADGALWLEVYEQDAVYPLTIDPVLSQQQKLTATDGATSDTFGTAVAISGETVVVGADGDASGAGAAYVFVRAGSTWSQQQKLTAADGAAGDTFGAAVAISGETVVVGADHDTIGATQQQGSVYVFLRAGAVWTQQAKLTATDGAAFDRLGTAVAISGETVIAGAFLDDIVANQNQGSAYVFVRAGAVWTQQAKLIASDGAMNDFFGQAVAINGETVVVGANGDDKGANLDQGSAYVFVRAGAVWTQQAKLTATDGATSDRFGIAVAISGDTIVVGADGAATGANQNQGAAYVFVRAGSTWSQQQKLTAADGAAGDTFGAAVAISGETIVVGATGSDAENFNQGLVYVFVRNSGVWSQQQKLSAADGAAGDGLGRSVAISGETLVAGANHDAVGPNPDQGSAYVFSCTGVHKWIPQAMVFDPGGDPEDNFGWAVAISGDTAVVSAWKADVGGNENQGLVYVFVRNAGGWSQQDTMTATNGFANAVFGAAVAIDGDTFAVASHEAVYVFVRNAGVWSQQQILTGESSSGFGIAVAISGETIVVGVPDEAHVFVRNGSTWSLQQKLLSDVPVTPCCPSEGFGVAVAISGETLVVGAPDADIDLIEQGAAYVYVRTGTVWTRQQKLTLGADVVYLARFGVTLGISGETIVVGAPFSHGAEIGEGSAYVFVRAGSTWSLQQKLIASDGDLRDEFGIAVAISGEAIVVGARRADGVRPITSSQQVRHQGAAYVFGRAGTVWSQQQKLIAADGAAEDEFGKSVAINGETVVVGAPSDAIGANLYQGSAHIFFRHCFTPPQITAAPVSCTAASPSASLNIATVSDADQAANTLTVKVNGGTTATVGGVTVANIFIGPMGFVSADVVADCSATTTAMFTLTATNSNALTATATLTVTVTPNPSPTLGAYPNKDIGLNGSTTVTPSAAPADNGTVSMLKATSATFTGSFGSNPGTGAITVANASPAGSHTVTVTATDDCGATSTTTFTVNVSTPPQINGATISRQQGNPASNSQIASVSDADQAADTLTVTVNNGAMATVNGVTVSGISVVANGNVTANVVAGCTATNATFTLAVKDNLNLTATASLTVNVSANTPPTLGNYLNTGVALNGSTTVTPSIAPTDNGTLDPLTLAAPTFTGMLSINQMTGVVTVAGAAPAGNHTVTVTAKDNCAEMTTSTFTLSVNSPPQISALAASQPRGVPGVVQPIANVSDLDQAANTLSVTVNGAASATLNGVSVGSLSIAASGSVTANVAAQCTAANASFTLTVTDSLGATAMATLMVTVTPDPVPPVLTCPANQTKATDPNQCQAVSNYPAPTVSDNCSGVGSVTCNPPSGSAFPKGTTTVNCSVMDAAGNPASCLFTVTVSDTQAPTINCPANISVPTAANQCQAVATYSTSASDNCSGVGSVTCNPPSGSAFPKGTTTVTCSVSDAAGNPASCSFTVTVNDTQAPTITCPANITVNAAANLCTASVPFNAPAASDNCPGVAAPVCKVGATVITSPHLFVKGVTTVTCTVKDLADNESLPCSFTVTVNDTQAPTISCPANLTVGTNSGCSYTGSIGQATATDNCDASVTITNNAPAFFPKGTTTVTWTATDDDNNHTTCTQIVTVVDDDAPTISCPANISVPAATGSCSAVVSYAAPVVSDNCPGVGAPSCSPASGAAFPKGTTTVNCSVSDAAGNSKACSFTITVLDTQSPAIICPANLIANAVNPGDTGVAVNFAATASDNCPGVSVVCVPPSGSSFATGTRTVTCTATDAAGNQASCSFTVRVFDYVIVDDTNGRILRFLSTTGEYDYFDCRKGTSLSGRGQVTQTSCKTELRDTGPNAKSPDRNIYASANPCTRAGTASVTFAGLTSTLMDANLSNNINRCP